jgi:hypothetical protein
MTKNNYKQEVLTLETRLKVISDSDNGMSRDVWQKNTTVVKLKFNKY